MRGAAQDTQGINWWKLTGRAQSLLRPRLGIDQQMERPCTVQHLFLLGFILLSPSFSLQLYLL